MIKICCRCFLVEVKGVRYLVKYGKIDDFVCLFLPSVVVIQSMVTTHVSWHNKFEWYKRF